MTSLAPFANLFVTVGQWFLACTVYACGVLIFVAIGVAKRKAREGAQEEELIRRCQEGRRLRETRETHRCLGGRRVA